ncbi:MAG: ATP-binding protein, partial [Gammaproteobacteria bacterium]
MPPEAWLPVRFELPDGAQSRRALYEGKDWQIIEIIGGGRALIARGELASRWHAGGLIGETEQAMFSFGEARYWSVSSGPSQVLIPVTSGKSPDTKEEALAFALALKATRAIDDSSPLQDGLYVEKISRVLPTYSISSVTDDDVVLGYWLTGGASISVTAFRRLSQTLSWLGEEHLKEVIEAAGFTVPELRFS